MAKTPRGTAIARFVEERKRALAALGANTIDAEILAFAMTVLDNAAANTQVWELDRNDFPSLPNRPVFSLRPGGRVYSNIPVPKAQRQSYGGAVQKQKRWTGEGLHAWIHYLAGIDDQVQMYAAPPEDSEVHLLPPGFEGLQPYMQRPDALITVPRSATLKRQMPRMGLPRRPCLSSAKRIVNNTGSSRFA